MTAKQIETLKLICPCCHTSLSSKEVKTMLRGLVVYKNQPNARRGNRFATMTPEERRQDAQRASQARWTRANTQLTETSFGSGGG